MNQLQATTMLQVVSVVIVAAKVVTATGQLEQISTQRSDWFQGCDTTEWPKCMAQSITRTLRMLEQSDTLQIANGVRLVKTPPTTIVRSTK